MFQQGSACYETAQAANAAQASNLVGTLVAIGTDTYAVNVEAVTDAAITLRLEQLAGTGTFSKVINATPQSCGLLQTEDALAIGWLIAAAWIGAFCVMFIARTFRDSINGPQDGNT